MIPSIVLCPVPYRLSKKCLVLASFTAMMGYCRTPFSAMERRRMTPVVVSSVPPDHSGKEVFAVGVQRGDEVGAVIHGHRRLQVQNRMDVPVIGLVVFPFDGEDRDFAGSSPERRPRRPGC